MRTPPAWLHFPTWNFVIGAHNKCGSTTLLDNFCTVHQAPPRRYERLRWEELPSGVRRIGVIRHPSQRFYSLYNEISNGQLGRGPGSLYQQMRGMSEWDVLAKIHELGLDYDAHFQPQSRIGLFHRGVDLVPLPDLDGWWQKHTGRELIHYRDRSQGKPWPVDSDVERRLKELYPSDFMLWERATDGTQ